MYKPVILLGNGIRSNPALIAHLCSLNVPVLTTWMACDLIPEDSPVYCGRPGILGMRAANIIQQMSDQLIVVGARLDGEQVAYDYDRFAPNATKYVYDIDDAELAKLPDNGRWIRIGGDLRDGMHRTTITPRPGWMKYCKSLYTRFRPELDGIRKPGKYVDPFALMSELHNVSRPDDVFALGSSGGAPCAFFQSYKIKQGQRVTNVSTIGAMGADVPMAIGAAMATRRRVICPTGDGGFMLNSQELETARRMKLDIAFLVFNNNGYNSIRVMQDARFSGHHVGCDPASGLTLPRLEDIAAAYRIWHAQLTGDNLDQLGDLLNAPGPIIIEVMVDPQYQQLPRVMASTVNGQLRTDDMERMTPYLPDEELKSIMEWGD